MNLKLAQLPGRTDYVDQVYKVILDAISDGSLAPGARITQEEIAAQLNVSRSPVLQAMRLLRKEGFLQEAPGRGVLVAPLDAGWIGKVYEVRGALDALAARLAAERGATLDPALISKGRSVSRGTDVKAMIDADLAFHLAIYRASGNELIEESAQLRWIHLRRVMGAVLQSRAHRTTVWDEHEAIAEAIGAGDGDRAAQLSELHAQRAQRNLVAELTQVLSAPARA
ncbi:GntR family transcriptional regulator [soil metagenome]